jgi:hypothetical protein
MGFFKWLFGNIKSSARPGANSRPQRSGRYTDPASDPFLRGTRPRSMSDPNNPFGWTNPLSPNNPHNIMRKQAAITRPAANHHPRPVNQHSPFRKH